MEGIYPNKTLAFCFALCKSKDMLGKAKNF